MRIAEAGSDQGRAGYQYDTRAARASWSSCVRLPLLLLLGLALVLAPAALSEGPLGPTSAHADTPPPPPPPRWPPDRGARRPTQAPPVVQPRGPVVRGVPAPPPPPGSPVQPIVRPAQPVVRPAQPAVQPRAPAAPVAAPAVGPRQPGAEPIIRRIEFEGTVVYSPASIKVLLRNKEGRRLDRAALDADKDTLFQYFKEVDIRQEQVPGGIVLRIRVSENPLVVELKLRGNLAIEEPGIKELMRTRVGFPLNPYHLSEDAQDIVAAYKLRGFHFAHVPEPLVTTLEGGGRRVDLSIVEGPEVEVERVVFRGNVSIPDKDLQEVMLTKSLAGLEAIFGDAPFREDAVMEDLVAIKQLYRDRGFLDVEVFLDDLRFSDDKSKVVVAIAVDEHRSYRVGRLVLEIIRFDEDPATGPTPEDVAYFTEERVRGWIGLEEGGAYSGEVLKEAVEKIQEEYFKRSFLEASVDVPEQIGRERDVVVDLKVVVTEGPKLRIARIDFVGNEFTRDKILRREVELSPGGYVDRGELQRGEARLKRTGWFDRATMRMQEAYDPTGKPLNGWKSVVYELVEGKTGNVNFGLGFSSSGGAFGSVQFTKRNFDIARPPRSFAEAFSRRAWTGAGQEFDVLLQPSTIESAFRVRFREPRLFGSKVSFEVSAFKGFSNREDYFVEQTGYGIAFGYPLYRATDERVSLTANARWRHEWIELREVEDDAVPGAFLFRGENELRAVQLSTRLRMVDDAVKRDWEFSASATAELAGTGFGGDLDFYKMGLTVSSSRVIFEDEDGDKQRFSARLTVGYAEALEDTPEVPPYERYYAGGNSFRGFANRGVGPHVRDSPTGGEWLVSGSFEYQYPLISQTIGVVAFADWGTVATSIDSDDAGRWRLAVGFGLRLIVPVLGDRPLAFDFGFPIFSEDEDEERVVSFSLGRNF